MPVIHLSSRHGAASAPSSGDPGDWRDRKRCADEDPDMFFPEIGEDPEEIAAGVQQARAAQDMCLVCPVIEQCGDFARAVGATSGVWGGVWLDEQQRREEEAEDERKRQEIARKRSEYGEKLKLILHEAIDLAFERGTQVILARLRGDEVHTIAEWAGVTAPVVQRALMILLPPADDHRVDVTGMERALRSALRIRVLVARGRSDQDIARLMRTTPLVIEQARLIIAHRDAANRQYRELAA